MEAGIRHQEEISRREIIKKSICVSKLNTLCEGGFVLVIFPIVSQISNKFKFRIKKTKSQ